MMRATTALGRVRVAAQRSLSSPSIRQRCYALPQTVLTSSLHRTRFFHSSSPLYEENRAVPEADLETLPPKTESAKPLPEIAFAFDIDGVLYRGSEAIKGASTLLCALREKGIRYTFLTNGGGTHEGYKAKSLMTKLGLEDSGDVIGDRIIQSHTPMKGWPAHIKENDTILVTGQNPHWVRKIAYQYGFKNVITPADLECARKELYPFVSPRAFNVASDRNKWVTSFPGDKKIFASEDPHTTDVPAESLKIDHIFVWNDPRDWSLDIQIIYDVLISHKGYIGTVSSQNGDSSLPSNGWQQDGQPGLWISNLDLFWKTQYPVNRFGTGAFVEALKAVWKAATNGAELQYTPMGKPLQTTYEYAHDKLLHMDENGNHAEQPAPLKRVYMIGDNPESDIRGANDFKAEDGTEWKSVLVRTGVWAPTASEPEPRHQPDVIVEDVVDAVLWALKNEGVEMSREQLEELGQERQRREGPLAVKRREEEQKALDEEAAVRKAARKARKKKKVKKMRAQKKEKVMMEKEKEMNEKERKEMAETAQTAESAEEAVEPKSSVL